MFVVLEPWRYILAAPITVRGMLVRKQCIRGLLSKPFSLSLSLSSLMYVLCTLALVF